MVFSSLIFIFQFLPVAVAAYYLCPVKYKNLALMVASLFFYTWGEVRYFPVMMALITANYFCAIYIKKYDNNDRLRRRVLGIAVGVSLGMLIFFKYLDFFIVTFNQLTGASIGTLGLTLPLGFSFYTFQTLAYTIDVYRRQVEPERDYISLAAFIVMFPQLIAGPIVRYTEIKDQLHQRKFELSAMEDGLEDFVIGLARKVLIANNVGMLWSEVESMGFTAISSGLAWLGLLAYSLQIYFDFSGYSQMAIGLGKMLGFTFPQNFDNPYISRSATEFWRRWHMSLGSWFKEYIYIPLGGSRRGRSRTYLNMFIVWACTGLWHGANWNFLLWGLFYFLLLTIERAGLLGTLNQYKLFSRVYTILIIMVGWALFAITDLSALSSFLARLFNPSYFLPENYVVGGLYYLRNYAVVLALGCFFSTSLPGRLYRRAREMKAVKTALICLLFLMSVAYLVDSTYNPFLYFRF